MKLYALLVGINDYPVKPLNGCINDLTAFEGYLRENFPEEGLHLQTLRNEEATRQNFIDAFALFGKAKQEDTCLLYFSGHGSYTPASGEFWTEADQNLETLVLFDSRNGAGDLIDKELGALIWQHTRTHKPGFIAVTDCCHSGSVTRNLAESGTDRTAPAGNQRVTVEQLYGYDPLDPDASAYEVAHTDGKMRVTPKTAPHIHLAASRDNQTAKEDVMAGQVHGYFTYSLLQTLNACQSNINYHRLMAEATVKVRSLARQQEPVLNIVGQTTDTRYQAFLGKDTIASGRNYLLYYHKDLSAWTLNAGAIHDIRKGDSVMAEGIGEWQITEVGQQISRILPGAGVTLDRNRQYPVSIQKTQLKRAAFAPGEWSDSMSLREQITLEAKDCSDFTVVNDGTEDFRIRLDHNHVYLTHRNGTRPLFKKVNRLTPKDFVEKADIVSRWEKLRDLHNPGSRIGPDKVRITVEDTESGEIRPADEHHYLLYYKWDAARNEWTPPVLRISVTQTTGFETLHIGTAFLAFDYGVDTSVFDKFALKKNESRDLFYQQGEIQVDRIPYRLDDKYSNLGYNQISEYLKVFISSQDIDLSDLYQEGIDLEESRGDAAAQDRSFDKFTPPPADDWQVFNLKFTITKPSEEKLPAHAQIETAGLKITNSTDFTGSVRLSTMEELKLRTVAIGDVSDRSMAVPPTLTAPLLHEKKGNEVLEPAALTPDAGPGQSPNILEILDVQHPGSVTAASPLKVRAGGISLAAEETIIPFGYDPETGAYFPIGFTESGADHQPEIVIRELPPETPADDVITTRSLGGSIKIYFYKIAQKLGFDYDYPQLAVAQVTPETLEINYLKDQKIVQNAVKEAKKILLFIHGIIGDTEEMTKVVRRARSADGRLLADKYDLVLTFDYENLDTRIQETAQKLKERLNGAGLGAGHQKELTIVAHSMGGLVSRYFIEKLRGDLVVNHLVMLGTPNGGSEWADVRDLAETLLTTAVNGAAFLKPWIIPLSLAGRLLKGTQTTLKQMNDKGELSIIPELADMSVTGTRYTLLAGNTRLLQGAEQEKVKGWLKKLAARFRSQPAYTALDLVIFQNEPNDIAVKVRNIRLVPAHTHIHEVASDHLSYFGDPLSYEKLGQAL